MTPGEYPAFKSIWPLLIEIGTADRDAAYDHCTVACLRQGRVSTARFVRLADIGIKGNSHMLMLEKNNLDVATVAATWLRELVDKSRSN